jgi:hypothetical protein
LTNGVFWLGEDGHVRGRGDEKEPGFFELITEHGYITVGRWGMLFAAYEVWMSNMNLMPLFGRHLIALGASYGICEGRKDFCSRTSAIRCKYTALIIGLF